MAEGMGATLANATATAAGAYQWVQLHVGAPGPNGTANVAANNTRKQATWTVTANTLTNAGDLLWSAVASAEDPTHFTVWSLVSGGTFGWSGTLTNNPVQVGDDLKYAAGQVTATVPVAS